jgi:putative membrane protein
MRLDEFLNSNYQAMKISFAILSSLLLAASSLTATAADTKAGLDANDEKFLKKAAENTKTEVEIAGLGVQKATRPEVKDLAQMLADDHAAAKDSLQALADSKSVQLSAVMIEPAGAAKFKEFEKLSGKAFDDEFLSYMAASHRKVVLSLEDAVKQLKDAELKSFADRRLTVLRDHLDKIVKLQPPPEAVPSPLPPI